MRPNPVSASLLAVFLGVGLTAPGCQFFLVKGGDLHERPSAAADLPFRSDGVYVTNGFPLPCGRDAEGIPDETVGPFSPSAVVFTDTGEFLIAGTEEDLGGNSPYAPARGNYRVDGDRVDARTLIPGGDSGYAGFVDRYPITPTGPESFVVEHIVEHPSEWLRYNVYSEPSRSCYRVAYTFKERRDTTGQ